ncbi:DUF1697 domain-containing protein [Devosia sp. PTR5]|uniref:DUF1697 domain-containing protein n=1 Tax=Devosia oryzisoli TaxID=2774138 RepID=A0A927ISV4_9HYPH|nr:DUF1697 domain-containing protein [Devosia oryzisoli]MBD8065086.1 DUF1697 domain-containing protein [Devosia oryzisoli]
MSELLPTYVILLRAIGPATHRLMRMAQWREKALSSGFLEAETLGNTGNMIAGFTGGAAAARETMAGVLGSFGLGENVVPVVRTVEEVQELVAAAPMADAAAARPSQTAVFFVAAQQPDFNWLAEYSGPERFHVWSNHLIVDFTQDVSQSGRLIRQIDKHCGTNTARNWNTTRKLAERCAARLASAPPKAPC